MSFLVAFLLLTAHSASGQDLDTKQVADGTPTFTYYNAIAKTAAAKLQKYLIDFDDGLDQCLAVNVILSSASQALKQYNALVVALNATKCAVSEKDKNHFSGAQAAINATVKTCFAFVPQDLRGALRKTVVDSIAEIQSIDNSLRWNAKSCLSVDPEPMSCEGDKITNLKNVNKTVTYDKLTRVGFLVRPAYFRAKAFVERCIEVATTDLRTELDAWITNLVVCQSSL